MKRTFAYIAVLAALAVLGVVLLAGRGSSPDDIAERSFLPEDVAGRINDVDTVEIVTAGDRTVATLNRTDGGWRAGHMHGYHANWRRLRKLLAELGQARVVEAKTDKPEYYERLGVGDVASETTTGVLVRLSIGEESAAVIIGNEPQGRSGQYARIAGEAASVQLDREIDVATGAMDWVDDEIVDIDAAEVAEVEIIHPGAGRVLATKVSAGQADFDLADMPEGRELTSSWAVNSLGSVLSLLDLEAVYPADDTDWADAVRLRMLTFTGLEVIAETIERDGEYLLRLEASQPAAALTVGTQADEEADDIERQAAEQIAQAVDEINRRTAGWVYAIAKYKHDVMVKKTDDLLKPLEAQ